MTADQVASSAAGTRPGPEPETSWRHSWTLTAAALAVLLTAADTYVVVLALPDMMLGVGLGIDEIQRATPIVSAFLLGYVATLPLIGRLADLRGSRPVVVGCLLVFCLGCLITATATDLHTLVAGRALQGIGGGGLVPATLALVAQIWPPQRRGMPLGVIGAVQEAGATIGPLAGAAVLALGGWRAIFWADLAAAAVLTGSILLSSSRGAPGPVPAPGGARRHQLVAGGLALLAVTGLALVLIPPESLASGVTLGRMWVPLVGEHVWAAPLSLATAAVGVTALVIWARAARVGDLLRRVDVVGSVLMTGALSCLVLAFATADPQVSLVTDDAGRLLAAFAVFAAGFVFRQRRASHPLVPPGTLRRRPAWAALLVNLLVGAGLVAALVDVPLFARATSQQDQFGAALVLVRLLVAMPVGAVLGGWLIRRFAPAPVAAAGLALGALGLAGMTRWDEATLTGAGGTLELVAAGLGIGLAIAPVNAALLAATRSGVHGIASALAVVARTVGMLTGISLLTAIGLRSFYREQARIGTVLDLCPTSPANCPAYTEATRAALLTELHAIFAGAGVCLLLAALASMLLLDRRPDRSGDPQDHPGSVVVNG